MSWIGWVATVGALILGIIVSVATLPAAYWPTFFIGLVVGLVVGAIGFVFAWFRRHGSAAIESNAVSATPVSERISLLESEIRDMNEQLAIARHDAISRNDLGIAGPGRPAWSGKSAKQQGKEVAAQARVDKILGEIEARKSQIENLRSQS